MKIWTRLLYVVILAAAVWGVVALRPTPGTAQIVTVEDEYFVTEVRPSKDDFGVAQTKGADTRNWVKVKSSTRINRRKWLGRDRGFEDHKISREEFWKVIQVGTKLKVNGGRNWDQTIVAKKIWL